MELKYFRIEKSDGVGQLIMNRPKKLNVMDGAFFEELIQAVDSIERDDEIRACVLWAEGKVFTGGLDLMSAMDMFSPATDGAKLAGNIRVYKTVKRWQDAFSKFEKCPKPFIAAVHSKCIGGGVDMITACDFRVCTKDAEFSIKETQIAIVADLGTLQRISKVTSKGLAREMAFTGEPLKSDRALHHGFVNTVYETKEEMIKGAISTAKIIATNSPIVVHGTKVAMNYADEHPTKEALQQVGMWNTAFLINEDLSEAFTSFMEKRKPKFSSKL